LGGHTILVTGAARAEASSKRGYAGEFGLEYFNSIQVLGSGGAIIDNYDKVHLVPFGEYLPLSAFLETLGLRQFVHIPGGFTSGSIRKALHVPGLPLVAPLICYEAIFTGQVRPRSITSEDDIGAIVNVTNDGWFGSTFGPYQHFAQARLRAIEEGLPLVRAANTGISAVVDPYGRIWSELPVGIEGVVDAYLPQKITPPFFSRHPLFGALLLSSLMFFTTLASLRRDLRGSTAS
jgi:apolipoprotein N-acyltransferase